MKEIYKLSDLSASSTARVVSVGGGDDIISRFRCLGIIKGTYISCLHRSPLGDPAAYLIRGAVIAIRDRDAALIGIER